MNDTPPAGSTGETFWDREFCLEELDMPGLGIDFLSESTGFLPNYSFDKDSALALRIGRSHGIKDRVERDLLDKPDKIVEVLDYFARNPTETSHMFSHVITVKGENIFTEADMYREEMLAFVYGGATWKLLVDVHVSRHQDTLMVDTVDIRGGGRDIYDFDYLEAPYEPARVQVGYEPRCGNSRSKNGSVFGHQVYFECTRDDFSHVFEEAQ